MKNADVVDNFVKGFVDGGRTGNVFIEDNVIYSYGHHFPLGIRFNDGVFAVNCDGYSQSTACHKGLLVRALEYDEIVFLDTKDMKRVIDKKITTKKELLVELRL